MGGRGKVGVSRPLRIEYPGAFYHVTSRGNERRTIFQSNIYPILNRSMSDMGPCGQPIEQKNYKGGKGESRIKNGY